ncbi:chaperone DnaJ protein [Trypanosoma conorhini]|uniref:Chaperone DnaJ protein n=1 Tax=Trypanosoma conorhini TaxID=83891 RepID=A0A422NGD8_9TRYP|nr:chaperone DnaJ protein [Trypanosoma conorhini]RNF04531.1 chaperone DnaJ protein [Trypanosoma conorhini]
MRSAEQMDAVVSPYEVLGVPTSASVADIRAAFKRLALCTHPDKQICGRSDGEELAVAHTIQPFHAVKEASELLLDPLRRARYDHGQEQALVRSIGAVSDRYDLSEFILVEEKCVGDVTVHDNRVLRMRVYTLECRCGGAFEVFVTECEAAAGGVDKFCECDCCSLVIAVTGGRAAFK